MNKSFDPTLWDCLRECHDSIFKLVKPTFEKTTNSPNPLMLVIKATELESGTKISVTLPDPAMLNKLDHTIGRDSVLACVNELLGNGTHLRSTDEEGRPTITIAVITVNQGSIVKIAVSGIEEAEALQIDPSAHPDRIEAIVMMFHTLGGTFPAIHPLKYTPEGPQPRHVEWVPFPPIDVIDSLVEGHAAASAAVNARPKSAVLH